MAMLTAGPPVQLRRETVEIPEWGGDVIVRGLTASESFAITAVRQQAMRRVLEEQRAARAAERPAPDVEMTFSEWRDYAAYVPQLLALTVTADGGLGLYSAYQWEAVGQHYPGVIQRLQAIAERLSGLVAEDVEKKLAERPELKFRLWLSVRMGVSPQALGEMLTAEEFHQLAAMHDAGEL